MAESRVIFLIIAAIIAGSLLLLSTNILGTVKGQISTILRIGETQKSKFSPGGLYQACDYWLSIGSERYNAKVILEDVKLPSYMAPYSDLRRCCGDTLEDLAKKCYTGSAAHECVGEGYIDSYYVSACVKACENILRIYQLCETNCPDKKYSCMDYLITNQGRDICREDVSVSGTALERACGEY